MFLNKETNVIYLKVDNLKYLPDFNEKADTDTNAHNKVGLIVHNIEYNDDRLKDVEEDRTHG